MGWRKRLPRLTGFTIGPVGLSWEQADSEKRIAQRLVNFLDDRRVLFNNYELEVPQYCVDSVLEIREFATMLLGDMPVADGVPAHLRAIRAACTKFLDDVQRNGRTVIITDGFRGGPDAWTFFTGLGEMRALIGVHLALLASQFDIKISGGLAGILPPEPEE